MNWSRWRLVLLLMAICYAGHFNRTGMAVAGDMRIMSEYAISPTQMGAIYTAFLIAYTLFMIPGGWLIDRSGPPLAMQVVCLGSALFVVLTGCVGLLIPSGGLALATFVAIRSLMGMVSAPLHPAAARAVSLEIPLLSRSTANGLITGAALLGVASTYLLFGQLIAWLRWPAAFVVAGIVTAVIGLLWGRYSHHTSSGGDILQASPQPLVGAVEAEAGLPFSLRRWFSDNRNLLLLTCSYSAVGYFQYLFFYWTHYYFETILKLGEERSQLFATFPPLAMAVGMPLGGWLSDRLRARFGWRPAYAGLAMTAMATSACLLLLGMAAREPFWIVTWLTLALGTLGSGGTVLGHRGGSRRAPRRALGVDLQHGRQRQRGPGAGHHSLDQRCPRIRLAKRIRRQQWRLPRRCRAVVLD